MVEVTCISAANLVNEACRRKLHHEGMLSSLANDDDIIWQQMTWENFEKLIINSQLHLKSYGSYSDYDERKLSFFIERYLPKFQNGDYDELKTNLERHYAEQERKMFISCWYNSKDLSDVVFKQYTGNGCGVAIGTTVSQLKKCLEKVDVEADKVVCGNVQYVPQRMLEKEELFGIDQIYAPIFLKGMQFRMDNEFRVCVHSNGTVSDGNEPIASDEFLNQIADVFDSLSITPMSKKIKWIEKIYEHIRSEEIKHISSMKLCVEPAELIRYIAVQDNGLYQKLGKKHLEKLLASSMQGSDRLGNIVMKYDENFNASGFLVFKNEG